MLLYRLYHDLFSHQLFNSDFWLFEFSVWLHVLGRSLISIFVPILMLKLGYTIGEVMIYYLIYNLLDVPLNFWARSLISKIGAKWVIIFATFFTISYFVAFYNLTVNNWTLLIVLALLAALYDSF